MTRHVAIYTDDPDKGGVANYNHQIACALREAGFRVSLVQTASSSLATQAQSAAGVSHEWISYDTGVDFVRTITDPSDAERAFNSLNPDVVLFSDCCPISNIAAKHVAIKMGLPFIVAVHFVASYLAERFANCLPVVAKQYHQANGVIAVSHENLALLHRLFGLHPRKGSVVHYGVPPRFFEPRNIERGAALRKKFGIPADALVSLTTARLSEVKGHVLQIHAMERLASERPGIKFVCVWVGGGELREKLEADIASRELTDRIFFAGQQSDISSWLEIADIFTLTSLSEGMPICIMEAMARGLPVVATAISGVPEELGQTGALLPDPQKNADGTVVQLAKTWSEWCRSADRRQIVGNAARLRARELFQAETMVAHVLGALEKCALRTGEETPV